ncbi:VOC family protein [Atopococcus tabaci]|uniref:VOC family protein n=1 Tax=Atopococcus tabaci TaxID=269774 RepID=UPI00240953BC|nr:VOC family protein [Atopococcus tabaci]
MVGVEMNMVVKDSLKALELYEEIFETERVEVTNFAPGTNEAIFTLHGMRIHMLDENPEYQMVAPKPEHPVTMWFNVIVPDIKETYSKAIRLGCKEIVGITEIPEMGVSNAIFLDPFGYQWLLHQVHREISFEERNRMFEEQFGTEE